MGSGSPVRHRSVGPRRRASGRDGGRPCRPRSPLRGPLGDSVSRSATSSVPSRLPPAVSNPMDPRSSSSASAGHPRRFDRIPAGRWRTPWPPRVGVRRAVCRGVSGSGGGEAALSPPTMLGTSFGGAATAAGRVPASGKTRWGLAAVGLSGSRRRHPPLRHGCSLPHAVSGGAQSWAREGSGFPLMGGNRQHEQRLLHRAPGISGQGGRIPEADRMAPRGDLPSRERGDRRRPVRTPAPSRNPYPPTMPTPDVKGGPLDIDIHAKALRHVEHVAHEAGILVLGGDIDRTPELRTAILRRKALREELGTGVVELTEAEVRFLSHRAAAPDRRRRLRDHRVSDLRKARVFPGHSCASG